MIKGMFDKGAMPVLERLVQFTSARHGVLAHNIANLSTPNFVPGDLSVEGFQASLGAAIDRRRNDRGVFMSELKPASTRQLKFGPDSMQAEAGRSRDNLLFHDRNNRSLEHQMKSLAENAMAHNMAMQMLKNQFDLLRTTIRERP